MELKDHTHVMGILNVTPDSFSDGGDYFSQETAIEYGLQMAEQGADILDIGGESTRPGADPVPEAEEIRRTIPVVRALSKQIQIPISIDTMKSNVAKAAIDAGATMINDVSGLHHDPRMAAVIAQYQAPIVLMHMRGTPKTMQSMTQYEDVVEEILQTLQKTVHFAREQGVSPKQIILDPGIGFGKTAEDNFCILHHLHRFKALNYPLLIGVSRKSFIGNMINRSEKDRLLGTAAAVTSSILSGVHIVRVHDVPEMIEVARIADQIRKAA